MQRLSLLTPSEAAEVAKIHHDGFANFFLTSLGLKFLKAFYSSAFKHPNGFGIGIFDEHDQLYGFALGCYPSNGFYLSLMRSNFIILALAMIPQFLKSPAKLLHILKAFKASNRKSVPSPKSAILLSICVLPTAKSKGNGKILLERFEQECLAQGAEEISLTTAFENNDVVNLFYQRNNYQNIETFVKLGHQKENVYLKKIT